MRTRTLTICLCVFAAATLLSTLVEPAGAGPAQRPPVGSPAFQAPSPLATPASGFDDGGSTVPTDLDLRDSLTYEEYAVLRAIIDTQFADPRIEQLVISDLTVEGWGDDTRIAGTIEDAWPQVPGAAAEELFERNQRNYALMDSFGLSRPVVLLSSEESREIFRDGGWEAFYERFPGAQGVMGVSRVGFDPDRRWALAYMGNQYHYLAGHGELYLLEKVDGEWTIVGAIFLWIS